MIDLRDAAPPDRQSLVFATYRSLGAGETMELIDDHEARPLYNQFLARMPGLFGLDYLQSGPEVWRVLITKVANPHSDGPCCGSCGGA